MWQSQKLMPTLIPKPRLFTLVLCRWITDICVWMVLDMELPWHSLQKAGRGLFVSCHWGQICWPWHQSRPGIWAAFSSLVLTLAKPLPWPWMMRRRCYYQAQGSNIAPYAITTCAQESCYAHQPLWSAASWKGQINHALIFMGQKVPVLPFYSIKSTPYPPLPSKHREMFPVSEKQKHSFLTRRDYIKIINSKCPG
jgi:hypothetical protein